MKKLQKSILLCLFFLFIFFKTVYAQESTVLKYSTTEGLSQNSITNLIFDKSRNLWIGTHGGLVVYDGLTFRSMSNSFMHKRTELLFKDKDGCIYNLDGRNNIYSNKNRQFKTLNLTGKYDQFFFNDSIFTSQLLSSPTEKYAILNFLGNKNIKKKTPFNIKFYYSELPKSKLNSPFMVDSMLLSHSNGKQLLHNYDGTTKKLKADFNLDMKNKGLIFQSDMATFWLYKNNIYRLRVQEDSLVTYLVQKNVPLDKTKDQLVCGEYNDLDNTYYFGSLTHGLFKVSSNSFKAVKGEVDPKKQLQLGSEAGYYSQVEISENSIMVSNYLMTDEKFNVKFKHIKYPYNRVANFKDKQSRYWYGDSDILIINDNGNEKKIKLNNNERAIISICQYDDTTFYATNTLEYLVITNNKVVDKRYKSKLGLKEDEYISHIYKSKSKNNKLYFLTTNGIKEYDKANGYSSSIESIPIADYRMMLDLDKDIAFVGTYGNGYFLFDGTNYHPMPLDKKGYLKFAHTALCDSNGYVWISTNNGLFRTRLQDMTDYLTGKTKNIFYYFYDKSSGFPTNEFNGGCQSPAIKLMDGRFSYSSMDGLVQFDPLKVPALLPDNPLQIIHLSLNGQPQDSIPQHLEISQDIKDIKLEVSTAYYGHPVNLVIQYKIPGYVDEWTDVTDQRYITIQNATYGNFNIEIRKRHGFGHDDFDYISYPVTVLPYYYQTWWFISIVFSTGLLLVYLFSRWHNRYMIQKNKNLESIIKERTMELSLANHNLKDQIKQNDLFQSIFVHDIKSPIRFISSNSELLRRHWSELDNDLKLSNLQHIHDASANIGNFIEETLLWMKIQKGELETKSEEFKVFPLLRGIVDLYKTNSKIINGDLQIVIRCNDELNCLGDSLLLATILRNLLANSIKYTKKGSIELFAIKSIDGKLSIGCEDTGVGMSPSLIDKILSKEYQGNDIRKDSFKMGFVIIKDITKTLNGILTITSEVNSGTKVSVEFMDNMINQ